MPRTAAAQARRLLRLLLLWDRAMPAGTDQWSHGEWLLPLKRIASAPAKVVGNSHCQHLRNL